MNEECVPGDSRHGSLATFSELVWFFGFWFFFFVFWFSRGFLAPKQKASGKPKKPKKQFGFFGFPKAPWLWGL